MLADYQKHDAERQALGIPPLPLDVSQAAAICEMLVNPRVEEGGPLLDLLVHRVPPGVDPAAKVKAAFLADIAMQRKRSPLLRAERAVEVLGTMLGGYNVPYLVEFLDDLVLAPAAAQALMNTILVFENFEAVEKLMRRGNRFARRVMESWAAEEWLARRPAFPEKLPLKVFKVKGEVNTDDLSPAGHAGTRPDIPLHALSLGETRFPGGIETIRRYRAQGHDVAFVGHTVGTGSSRKSATNSLIWHIGHDIPHVPNKRTGGVVLAEAIAPIFFNTFEDAGGLPIRCEVGKLRTGGCIEIDLRAGTIRNRQGKLLATFELAPASLADEVRAGGRVPLIIGRKLTARAQEALGTASAARTTAAANVSSPRASAFTLAQKLVGRACGAEGVFPGATCEPRMTTVGSQDTTGPMTRDELNELACLSFQSDLVMQSFCHTAAYPTDRDRAMHKPLPAFFAGRGGVALRPGDGIIHSWLNRLLLPDTVGTGGDSHTRFPLGISFPAGSGLVAFAAALGCMPLDMPESVLVRFTGALPQGITLRDLVNAIPLCAIREGLLDRPGTGARNVFNSRILEMEGLPDLAVEQAFELTCASAERSAAAATIALSPQAVATYVKSNVALMRSLLKDGYDSATALRRRIAAAEAWLADPVLLARDAQAAFAATLEIDLASIDEPVVACPNAPDLVQPLSAVAGQPVDEVFIGSCMTNIGHFRAAARFFLGADAAVRVKRFWITPPTRMDREELAQEGVIQLFEKLGARVEIPGCSLCMGNQARVADGAVVFSTSTRNFDHRLGKDAQVYLGSAELAALTARLGRIPTPEEYFSAYAERVAPERGAIYRYLNFHELPAYAGARI